MKKLLIGFVFAVLRTSCHQNIAPAQFGVPQQQFVQQPVQGHQYGVQQQQYGQPQVQHQYMQQPQMGMQQMQPGVQVGQAGQPNLLDKSRTHDRAHIQEHLQELIGSEGQDLSKMSEEELQFHYFKLHDSDDNNKLDGLELVKSLIHWHVEESKHIQNQQQQAGQQQHQTQPPHAHQGTTKLFTDQELSSMIDPILQMDDKNGDGFIDYPEFVNAQKSRGF